MGCFYRTANQHTEFGIFMQEKDKLKSKNLCAAECYDDSFNIICQDHDNLEQRLHYLVRSSNHINEVAPQDTLTHQAAPSQAAPSQSITYKMNTQQFLDLEKAQFQNKHTNFVGHVSKCKSTNHKKNFLKMPADENRRNMNVTARAIGWSLSYVNSCLSTMQNTKNSVSVPKLYPLNGRLKNINNCIRTFCNNEYTHSRKICCQRTSRHFNHDSSHYQMTTTNTTTSRADNAAEQQLSSSHPYASTAAALNCLNYNNYNIIRNSINFYTASSVILVLCYLTTTTTATTTNSETTQLDKHPIKGIDWTKFDETSSDKEILDLLLEKKRYDKRLLPPVNDEDFCCGLQSPDMAKIHKVKKLQKRGTLTVNVNVLLLSLASPDESSLKYEVEFLLNQQWADPRLQYGNKSHYDFLNALHHHDHIWTPDTYFIMHGDFKDPIIPMHFALRIYRNGTITYAMRRHLILSCQGSLHIFPFDDPKCSFSMESISYEEAQIKYVWKNDEDTLRKSPSLTTLNAYLIKNQTTACDLNSWRGNYSCLRVDLIFTRDRAFYFTTVFIPGIILVTSSFITFWLEWNAVPARSMIGNYSCLQVELTFTRDRAYYFTTVFIPGIILVTSSFITFWLEWNAVPARVMIGVTTMLNFFTTSNGFRSTLPVVSNLTAMNVWDGVCMCFIYASLLEFVCVNYFGRKTPKRDAVYRPGENVVTQHLPAVLNRIGVILASPLGLIEREFQAATEKPTHERKNVGKDTQRTVTTAGDDNSKAVNTIPFMDVNVTQDDDFSRLKSTATNTPPLIFRGDSIQVQIHQQADMEPSTSSTVHERASEQFNINQRLALSSATQSKSISSSLDKVIKFNDDVGIKSGLRNSQKVVFNFNDVYQGEKRRDEVTNEIVACTICGGLGSPCTHSAKNGCAPESCFVQVRKREPHHPIRVAKTIDVIARITFPTAYAIFLIFFFVHYKGFS